MSKRVQNLTSQTTAAEAQFLRTEIHAGLSFSKMALEAEDQSKIDRNRANAHKAYDALLQFHSECSPFAAEIKEINSQQYAHSPDPRPLHQPGSVFGLEIGL